MLESFRAKLMVLVLLTAIPAFALTLQRSLSQRGVEKEQVLHEISAVSRLIAAKEQSFVRNARQLLATLSGLDFLVHAKDKSFCAVHFENLIKLSPDYLNFGLIESDGTVFAAGVTPASEVDSLKDRSYFKRTCNSQKFSIGEYQVGRLTGQRSLNFGFPVVNQSNQLSRVLFASLSLEKLASEVRGITLPPGGVATVVDSGGHILVRLPDEGGWVGRSVPDTQLVREALRIKEGIVESKGLDGIDRVYAITPIADDLSARLFVTVGVPTNVLFANANQSLKRNLLVMVLTLIVALFVASLFAERALVKPVSELSATAHQLAAGNLSARSPVFTSTGEIRHLSEAINSMASRLQERDADLSKAHEEIRKINTELEQRVTDRTAELTAANQELESFSYSVSHDLRAPLRHLDGFAELLLRQQSGKLDEKGQRHLRIISDAARKMGTLIDDLLVFSRMGRQEMQKARVDTKALVDDAVAQLAPDCSGRSIEWEIADLPVVIGDGAMLKQIWLNLISNAIKYTRPRESARITVGYQEDASQHIFHVRDNGVGFDMRYADKLFGVFQRLHAETEFEGTGVGLANVRRIALRHGGQTWAESEIGQGSTFYFSLSKNA